MSDEYLKLNMKRLKHYLQSTGDNVHGYIEDIELMQTRLDAAESLVNETNLEYWKVTGEYWLPTDMAGNAIITTERYKQ